MRRVRKKLDSDTQTEIQCSPHILNEGDLAKVQSNKIVQTIASLPAFADETLIYEQLQRVDPREIKEDALLIIKYGQQRKLQFLLPGEDPDIETNGSVVDSALDNETSDSLEPEMLSTQETVEIPDNMENKEVMTRLMVFPHFLNPRELATISCDFSTQTDVSCQPTCSLTEIIPKLKSYLNHDGREVFPGDTRQNRSILDIIRGIIEDVEESHKHIFDADFAPAFASPAISNYEPLEGKNEAPMNHCAICKEKDLSGNLAGIKDQCEVKVCCTSHLNQSLPCSEQASVIENSNDVTSSEPEFPKDTSLKEASELSPKSEESSMLKNILSDIIPGRVTEEASVSEKITVSQTSPEAPKDNSSKESSGKVPKDEETPFEQSSMLKNILSDILPGRETEEASVSEQITSSIPEAPKDNSSKESSEKLPKDGEKPSEQSSTVNDIPNDFVPEKIPEVETKTEDVESFSEKRQKLEDIIDMEEEIISVINRSELSNVSMADKSASTSYIYNTEEKIGDGCKQLMAEYAEGNKDAECICGGLKIKLYIKDVDDPSKRTQVELNILPGLQKLEVRAIPEKIEEDMFISEEVCGATCCTSDNPYGEIESKSYTLPDGRKTRCPRIITRLEKSRKQITRETSEKIDSNELVSDENLKLAKEGANGIISASEEDNNYNKHEEGDNIDIEHEKDQNEIISIPEEDNINMKQEEEQNGAISSSEEDNIDIKTDEEQNGIISSSKEDNIDNNHEEGQNGIKSLSDDDNIDIKHEEEPIINAEKLDEYVDDKSASNEDNTNINNNEVQSPLNAENSEEPIPKFEESFRTSFTDPVSRDTLDELFEEEHDEEKFKNTTEIENDFKTQKDEYANNIEKKDDNNIEENVNKNAKNKEKECICDNYLEVNDFAIEYDEESTKEEIEYGSWEFCEQKMVKKKKSRGLLNSKAVSVSNLLDGAIMALVSKSNEGFNIQLNVKNTNATNFIHNAENNTCICLPKSQVHPCNCDPKNPSQLCKCGGQNQSGQNLEENFSEELRNIIMTDDEYETCSEGPSTNRSKKINIQDFSLEPSTTAKLTLPDKTVLNVKLTVQPTKPSVSIHKTQYMVEKKSLPANVVSGILPFRDKKRINVIKSMEGSIVSESFLRKFNPYPMVSESTNTIDILTPMMSSESLMSSRYNFDNISGMGSARHSVVLFNDVVEYDIASSTNYSGNPSSHLGNPNPSDLGNPIEHSCTKDTCKYISGKVYNPQNAICACAQTTGNISPCSVTTCQFAKPSTIKTEKPDIVFMCYKACEELFKPIQKTFVNLQQELKSLNMPEIDCIFSKPKPIQDIPKYTTFQKKMREFNRQGISIKDDNSSKYKYNFPVIKVQIKGSQAGVPENIKLHPKLTFKYAKPESVTTSSDKVLSSESKSCCSVTKCKRLASNFSQQIPDPNAQNKSSNHKYKLETTAVFEIKPPPSDIKINKYRKIPSTNGPQRPANSFQSYSSDICYHNCGPQPSNSSKSYIHYNGSESSYNYDDCMKKYSSGSSRKQVYCCTPSYNFCPKYSSQSRRTCASYKSRESTNSMRNCDIYGPHNYEPMSFYDKATYNCCMKHSSQSGRSGTSYKTQYSDNIFMNPNNYSPQKPFNYVGSYQNEPDFYGCKYQLTKNDGRMRSSNSRRISFQVISNETIPKPTSKTQNNDYPKCEFYATDPSTAQYYDSAYYSTSNSPKTNTRCKSTYSNHNNRPQTPVQRTKVKINLNEMRRQISPRNSDKSIQMTFRGCRNQSSHSLCPNLSTSGSIGQEDKDWDSDSLSNVSSRVSSEDFICPKVCPSACPKVCPSACPKVDTKRAKKRKLPSKSSRGASSGSDKNEGENMSYPFLEALSYFASPRKKGKSSSSHGECYTKSYKHPYN